MVYIEHLATCVNVFFLIFYECVLYLIALGAIPKTIFSFFYYKKYRESLLPRLGLRPTLFRDNPLPSIWIHAVSVGETKAIVPLARELNRRYPDNPMIISSITETGHAEAKRSLPFADYHVYLPFDFCRLVKRMINKASPGVVILCESDFWFNFLHQARKSGASVILANGKMSERSMRRLSWVPFFSKRLFSLFDVLCVQNLLYRSRFIKAGALPDKITVTGNLKLDEEYPQLTKVEVTELRQKLGILSDQPVLTIGSSHDPEEKFFLKVLKELWKRTLNLRVILVPRKPEHFEEVAQLLERERLKWISFTDINRRTGNEQVILIDAMGLLRMCYQLSDFALVGGSFTEQVGGHNILEPCWYGKPVLFGPHMHSQLESVELMTQYGAGVQVQHDQLQLVLEKWLDHRQVPQEIGLNGLNLVKELKGSTQRTLQAIEPYLESLIKI